MIRLTHALRLAGLIAFSLSFDAFGVLQPSEVVLLYNSEHRESNAIAQYYLAHYPGVLAFDLGPSLPQYATPPDPDNPGTHAVNQFFITPQGYEDWIRAPVLQFMAQHPEVKAMATTRGLPVVLATDFTPGADHSTAGPMWGGLEGKLAGLGFDFDFIQFNPNPYFGRDGQAFGDFLLEPSPVGQCYAGRLYLVSRLDSDKPDPPVDVDQDGDVDYVDGVKALIDRSLNLVVNTVQTTLVLDDKPWGALPPDCLARDRRALDYMYDQGWCTYYDASCDFLEGGLSPPASPGQQGWHSDIEGLYTDKPELMHSGYGRNHASDASGLCGQCEDPDNGYVLDYVPHPAGLFASLESWNGTALWNPLSFFHGQVWHWIGRGGSFTCANVNGPPGAGFSLYADFVVTNLYVHRLSWAEAVWSSLAYIGNFQTPLGDPLARVTIHDPDVNNDHVVNTADYDLVAQGADVDGDGDSDVSDILIVIESWEDGCAFGAPNASSESWPPPPPMPAPGIHWLGDALVGKEHDGRVNADDLDVVLAQFGSCEPGGDVTGDHVVDGNDILDVLCNWGRLWGDVDGDCAVTVDDFLIIVSQANQPCPCTADIASGVPEWNPQPDGVVNSFDWNVASVHNGSTSPECPNPPPPQVLATIPPAYLTGLSYPDCNRNLIPDDCEIAHGWVADANVNGIPDECE